MKRIILILLTTGVLISSCQKAEELTYSSPENIYFNFNDDGTKDRDSVIYTFAYTPGLASDTVFLPVSISGIRQPFDRHFKVAVIPDSTTAIAGTHYEALKEQYTIPADSGKIQLPIIVYNTDPSLADQSVTLNVRLVATGDFATDIVGMTRGKLILSNKLEKPYWWGPGPDTWGIPGYSMVKHELWLIATGVIDLPFNGMNAPQYLYFNGLLTSLLNNPATWIKNNPDKGYVLELRTDGNYDFYNVATPAKKILYQKNPDTGKFFFIDEAGKEIV